MTTPKAGSINVHRASTQKAAINTQAKPAKTSFAETLAAKVKGAADAADPSAANAAAIEDAKQQLGLELVKSILKNPKPGNIDRETPTNLDDE